MFDCHDPAISAALLKAYVRELPSPLIPTEFYNRAIDLVEDHLGRARKLIEENRYWEWIWVKESFYVFQIKCK